MIRRLLIVDDHKIVRAGIASLLKDSWDICGEAENGKEAVDKVLELKPDLVLLDLSMPVMGGTEAARQIRRLSPATKIIFLSMHDSETTIKLEMMVGADGYLSKSCTPAQLHQVIAGALNESCRIDTLAQLGTGPSPQRRH